MATYRVAFDGKWRDSKIRMRRWPGRGRSVTAVFPDSQAEEGRELWRTRLDGYLGGRAV
jgi:hypothetical protein